MSPNWLTQLGRLWGGQAVRSCSLVHFVLGSVSSWQSVGKLSVADKQVVQATMLCDRTYQLQMPRATTSRICLAELFSRLYINGWKRLGQCTYCQQVGLPGLPAVLSALLRCLAQVWQHYATVWQEPCKPGKCTVVGIAPKLALFSANFSEVWLLKHQHPPCNLGSAVKSCNFQLRTCHSISCNGTAFFLLPCGTLAHAAAPKPVPCPHQHERLHVSTCYDLESGPL